MAPSESTREAFADTLAVFDETTPPAQPLTTSEVADAVDCTRRTAYNRLERLVDDGVLETKKVGASGRVWWRSRSTRPQSGPRSIVADEDVTELDEKARRLEGRRDELEDVFDTVSDGFYRLDEDLRFTYANDRVEALLGVDASAALGRDIREELALTDRFEQALRETLEGGDPVFLEEYHEPLGAWFENALYPSETGVSVCFRDVTDRKERERRLEEYRRWNRTLIENFPNGVVALVDEDLRYVTFGGTPEGETDVTRADVEGGLVREVLPQRIADVVAPRYEAALEGESSKFEATIDERVYRFRFVPVRDDDGDVFAATGMSQDITEQTERERKLEHQREQLTALNQLNGIVREVTDAVIDQSTREEVERVVCRALAEADAYEFAWIVDVDPRTESVRTRVEAGVDGYADEVSLSVDEDDPRGQGPAGRAIRTHEVQVTRDAFSDPTFEPWRDLAREYGYRSCVTIPIVHEETLYGVIGVYSSREDAFQDDKCEVIGQLGEVVGHAIAAIERKQALMTDDIVEMEFRIPDFFGGVSLEMEAGESIAFDQTVPVGDDVYLQYGTVTDEAISALEALVDELPFWDDVTIHEQRFGETQFELRLAEPPMVSAIASHGGRVKRARIEDGTGYMTIHLPHSVEVHHIVDVLEDSYPAAELVTRRSVTRTDDAATRLARVFTDELTDRQRAAVEAAYHSGYFERPRRSSGEEVADSLNIAGPTFHQHLRLAQQKLFGELVTGSVSSIESE